MTEKIRFSVEDAKIVSENPNSSFAILSLDFFASGENLHEMYVSEETLMRTAETIKNCPLVWKYDPKLDDVYTHDKDEVPCGFVPENAKITSRILEDGRTMLTVTAYVWKRYTGQLLSFFKRDGGKKPVSVEMIVKSKRFLENGLLELLDFVYQGITILGSFVTPAIPLANASVVSFSEKLIEEYNDDFVKEFHYQEGNPKIPESVKENAKKGLELRKDNNKAGTAVDVAFAKHLIKNDEISLEDANLIVAYFSTHKKSKKEHEPLTENHISSLMWGGDIALSWAKSVIKAEEDSDLLTFPYKSMKDVNPALKGISPPISLEQANAIAAQADAVGSDDKKNGWAIAISSFKKTHVVKDGKWVKKSQKTEMAMKKTKEELMAMSAEELQAYKESLEPEDLNEFEELMAEDSPEQKNIEEDKEEKEEEKEEQEEEKEEQKEENKKFEFPKNFNMEMMGEMFASEDESEEEDENLKMAKEEVAKGEFANPSVIMSGMFAKMCKMSKMIAKMAEDNKVYMQENAELKKFKADLETQQKNFEVERTIKELSDKVVLPDEAKEEMIADAEKYSFETLETWKQACKAKCLDFAIKENSEQGSIVKVDLLWANLASRNNRSDQLWS